MSLNSPFFLFVFLPLVLVISWLFGRRLRLGWLLLASLFFYAWGQILYTPVILLSVLANYSFGIWISRSAGQPHKSRRITTLAVIINLALLAFFKGLVTYWPQIASAFGGKVMTLGRYIELPLGISFYSFAAVSYLIDVYKDRVRPEGRLERFALFLMLFPKVTAGPIMRYRDLAGSLAGVGNLPDDRVTIQIETIASGARRFIIGLAKKILIADRLAMVSDQGIFNQALPNLTTIQAWFVLLCFALQIYYDFSGYTDMAIGLGQMLGFRFVENFNYPYISRSLSEFWRRWHISLSQWFRDYLFYPLERRRRGAGGILPYLNILIVFLATGLWHGVTLNFIIWGLIHGFAISLEVSPLGRWLRALPQGLQHLYALAVILLGWVFFRSNNPAFAVGFLGELSGIHPGSGIMPFLMFPSVQPLTWMALFVGVVFAMPVSTWIGGMLKEKKGTIWWIRDAGALVLLASSLVVMAGSAYSPYIYGGF